MIRHVSAILLFLPVTNVEFSVYRQGIQINALGTVPIFKGRADADPEIFLIAFFGIE